MNALRRLGTVGSSSSAAQDKAAAAAAQGLDINGKPLERQFGLENVGLLRCSSLRIMLIDL